MSNVSSLLWFDGPVVDQTLLVPNQLPDSKKKEQYGYHQIMEKNGGQYVLSAKDKQSNADSYALAAGGKCISIPAVG